MECDGRPDPALALRDMRAWLIYLTNFLFASALGVVFVFLEDIQR